MWDVPRKGDGRGRRGEWVEATNDSIGVMKERAWPGFLKPVSVLAEKAFSAFGGKES